jgi:5-methyltetrahydropteroyltriglutamate--homocysteine methyltransferase
MKRSEDRILTTHVGSLVRPPELLAAIKAAREDPSKAAARDEVLRAAIHDIVRKQAEVGLDVINDGELSKAHWAAYVLDRMEGFEVRPDKLHRPDWLGRDLERFPEVFAEAMPHVLKGMPEQACVGPIRYRDTDAVRHALDDFLAALKTVDVEDGFFTAVAPASTAYDGVDEHYGNEHDFVYAIADALRTEYQEIHKAGLLLQVDDAVLANMYDTLTRRAPERYREWANLRVEALNHALEGIPEDRVRYHVCFGSWHVPHIEDAPLEDIIALILKVKTGALLIEAANPRHEHEWRVWERHALRDGQVLIPGVITHHTIVVEHPQLVADRIVRFANIVGRENVIAGADCGFAQLEHLQRVPASVQWAKFEALVEGARIASKTLWS